MADYLRRLRDALSFGEAINGFAHGATNFGFGVKTHLLTQKVGKKYCYFANNTYLCMVYIPKFGEL